MSDYRLNLLVLCAVSSVSILCSGYMCYISVLPSNEQYDWNIITASVLCCIASLFGLCVAITMDSLDKNRSKLHDLPAKFDDLPLPGFNKRILVRSQSVDSINV